MPSPSFKDLPGYDPDVAPSRAKARRTMEKLGYGPDKPLLVTVTTRNVQAYRDAAVILISQLKEISSAPISTPIDTTQWYPTLMRKDNKVAVNITEIAVDDPNVAFYENYKCGAPRNYTNYSMPRTTGSSTDNRRRPTRRSGKS